MGATAKSKRIRWGEITKKGKDGYCPHCPPHKGDNTTRKKPKSDKHKNKRPRKKGRKKSK